MGELLESDTIKEKKGYGNRDGGKQGNGSSRGQLG